MSPSLVADLAPVHILADVAALRLEYIEAFVYRHSLTSGLLSVNTNLQQIMSGSYEISRILAHLSGQEPAFLSGCLPGNLLAGGDGLLGADLRHFHSALLHGLLDAIGPRFLHFNRGTDLPFHIEAVLMGRHSAHRPLLGDTLPLRGQNMHIRAPGHRHVGALVLLDLSGHGDYDVSCDVLAPLLSGVSADLLLHWSLNQLGNFATPMMINT